MPLTTYIKGIGSERVFVGIPTAGGVETPFLASLIETTQLLSNLNIGIDFCIESGNCHVDDARNSIVRQFLATDCTDLIFIDADIGWNCADFVKLIKFKKDVVGGVYPKKQDDEDFPFLGLAGEIWSDEEGLVEVAGLPTGFLRIKRHVVEKLVEKETSRSWTGSNGEIYHPIFERIIADGKRMSGDYAFCHKWKKLGGKLYCDLEMQFAHEGKKTWEGKLGDFLRKKNNITNPKVVRLIHRLKNGEDDAEIFVKLFEEWGNKWAASPEMLATCYKMANGSVLETGSGLSTLVMAAKGATVYALENDYDWYLKTKKALEDCGLRANLLYVGLRNYGEFTWYEIPVPNILPDEFDLTVIDGPVRKYGRKGVFELLRNNIKNSKIIMDDVEEYLPLLKEWETQVFGELRKFAIGIKNGDTTRL